MHGHRAVVALLLQRAGGGSEGGAGPASVDDFMKGSEKELKEREAKVVPGAAAGVKWLLPSSATPVTRAVMHAPPPQPLRITATQPCPIPTPAPCLQASTSAAGGGPTAVSIPRPEVEDEALADTFKRKGNELFVAGDFEAAAKVYELALSHWTRWVHPVDGAASRAAGGGWRRRARQPYALFEGLATLTKRVRAVVTRLAGPWPAAPPQERDGVEQPRRLLPAAAAL